VCLANDSRFSIILFIAKTLKNKPEAGKVMISTTSHTAKKPTHVFEVSGIGFAPFGVVSPSHDFQQACSVFWCEHCGRTLKHRHFVKDVHGKIAVVGSQCILKSGDAGKLKQLRRRKWR